MPDDTITTPELFAGPPTPVGAIRRRGPDEHGYPHFERLAAIAECPACGDRVECWQETEEWTEDAKGKMQHSGWGPAMGVCEACSLLIMDSWDGCEVYDMDPEAVRRSDPDDDDEEDDDWDDDFYP